jgi:benzoyl-CoA reductase/2-hydroxyglutaryl-CoA dehydratase subunit BcrC/BadD/HgdB
MEDPGKRPAYALENILEAFKVRWEYTRKKGDRYGSEMFYKLMSEVYEELIHARENNMLVTLSQMYGPVEIYKAMDIAYLLLEDFCLISGNLGEATRYFEASEGIGYPKETCRVGSLVSGLAAEGVIPKPDFITSVGFLCDTCETPAWVMTKLFDVPEYFIDSGYDSRNPDTIQYYRDQLVEFVKVLEDTYNKKLDEDRLREVVKHSKEATEWFYKCNQFRTCVPLPVSAKETIKNYSLCLEQVGHPELTKLLEWHYYQIKERADKGIGLIPEEKHRIFWIGSYPFFWLNASEWLAEAHQSVVVGDFFDARNFNTLLPSFTSDTDDPYQYMAEKTLNWPGARCCQSFDDYMPDLVQFCNEAKVDIAVMYMNFGCKNVAAHKGAWVDRLEKECGVRTLFIDGDILDPRVASPEQIRNQFDEYFRVIDR